MLELGEPFNAKSSPGGSGAPGRFRGGQDRRRRSSNCPASGSAASAGNLKACAAWTERAAGRRLCRGPRLLQRTRREPPTTTRRPFQ